VRTLRKLVLGETWTLPAGIVAAVLGAVVVREVAGSSGWWEPGGGFVLLGLLVVAFCVALAGLRR
jgi:hypothetical protein